MTNSEIKILQKPILGMNLDILYSNYSNYLIPEFIADNPNLALKQIKKTFKKKPNVDGNNIEGIVKLRNEIFTIAKKEKYINPFVITASHTHWDKPKPVIYKFDKNNKRYLIGQHKIDKKLIYYPVSFVFDNQNYLPYEWAVNINFITNEYIKAISIVRMLTKKINVTKYPLGISIDFRFKNSLFDKPIPTVELPIDEIENKYYGYSEIITLENFESSQIEETTEQVGWYPFSDYLLNLDNSEQKILNELRTLIRQSKKSKLLMKELEEYIK
jgi:hypothetical protein